MDLADALIIAVVGAAAIHGMRTGAASQIVSFCGFLAGLAVGAVLVLVIDGHVAGQLTKTVVALVLLVVPASALGSVGHRLGWRLARLLRRVRLGVADAVLGASVSIAGSLVVCWLFASILVNSAYPSISRQIENSRIIRGVEDVMPPIPDAFSSVERYLSTSGFPQVLVNVLPESVAPVGLPSSAAVRHVVEETEASTVKIAALGCGGEQEGSGFVVAATPNADLVVTNAHVIAGTQAISVITAGGISTRARPVLFDPRFDLAVLKTKPLGVPTLPIDPSVVERGDAAVVLGYPGGGGFRADKAGILARFAAEGRDIYDDALTVRTVYELEATVRPGNSGGPLVGDAGQVIGVVFSRSASNDNLGFALASPGVLQRVEQAEGNPNTVVSTRGCAS